MKTFRTFGLTLIAIILCVNFAACSSGGDDPIEPTPTPEVPKSEITIDSNLIANGLSFSYEKGEQSISFITNGNWTLSVAATTSGATWCTASVTSGSTGTANVKFTVTENTDYEDRSVSITIKSGTATKTFKITQKSKEALLVTTNKYEVSQEGGTIDIEVKANIEYKMEISEKDKEWIKESESRGLTTYKHTLDIAENPDAKEREGEVYFKSGDKVETVKVYQTGSEAVIMLSKNEYTVSDQGETISVDIKSNIEFGVKMPNVNWIADEASSRGLSSHTLKYIVKPNDTYDNRSAEIIFYDKNSDLKETLKIIQTQKDAIVISKKEYEVKAEGETITVTTKANVDYQIEIAENAQGWIEESKSRGLSTTQHSFVVAANEDNEKREGEILFKSKDSAITEKIIIRQEKSDSFKIEAVDLGLSVKWGSCSLGASEIRGMGDFYAWGEVKPKKEYSKDTYQYWDKENSSYISIGTEISGTEYDPATAILGKGWRLPTKEECEELMSKCDSWANQTDDKPYLFVMKSKINQQSIYFGGYRYASPTILGDDYSAYFMSGSLVDGSVFVVEITADYHKGIKLNRELGYEIRPVYDGE